MTNKIKLAAIVNDATKDMSSYQLGKFRAALAETIPQAVRDAAEIVKAETNQGDDNGGGIKEPVN
jgi:hypothetical protein